MLLAQAAEPLRRRLFGDADSSQLLNYGRRLPTAIVRGWPGNWGCIVGVKAETRMARSAILAVRVALPLPCDSSDIAQVRMVYRKSPALVWWRRFLRL